MSSRAACALVFSAFLVCFASVSSVHAQKRAVWGKGTSGGGMAVAKSLACERAMEDATSACQNAGCPDGCARQLPCDCLCLEQDFVCICNVFAELCEKGDEPDDPNKCNPKFQSCIPEVA